MAVTREVFVALVTDNADDEKRGRIKVACAGLMGVDPDSGDPVEYPDWVPPGFPHLESSDGEIVDSGMFYIPNVGTTVEIEITTGTSHDRSPGQASISNPDPRWKVCLLQPGDAISDDFTRNYPERKGWRTKAGHLLLFDDSDSGDRQVTLRHGGPDGDGAGPFVSLLADGSIQMGTPTGQLIYINAADGEKADSAVVVLDANRNLISMTEKQLLLVQGEKGHTITMNTDGVFIASQGVCTVVANDVALSASSVSLGANAAEAIIKGNTFQTLFNSHTHNFVGNLGVPGVTLTPTVPLTGSELSTVVTTE